MDAQIKSLLTSGIQSGAVFIATWAVGVGIIPGQEKDSAANIIVSVVLYAVAAAATWYKKQQHTPTAQIAAVNAADNGVKVVANSTPGPVVNTPLKGAN